MPQNDFYTKVRAGLAALLRQWRSLGRADIDQLALILAETARVAKLGTPETTPSGIELARWSEDSEGNMPLWAPRTAVFLLNQMPARPTPQSEEEACAWAYCWLKNRAFDTLEAARSALPVHLQPPLHAPMEAAWRDQQGLRLV